MSLAPRKVIETLTEIRDSAGWPEYVEALQAAIDLQATVLAARVELPEPDATTEVGGVWLEEKVRQYGDRCAAAAAARATHQESTHGR